MAAVFSFFAGATVRGLKPGRDSCCDPGPLRRLAYVLSVLVTAARPGLNQGEFPDVRGVIFVDSGGMLMLLLGFVRP